MVHATIIARLSDSLPLAASMDDERGDSDLNEYKNQAKHLLRKLSDQSETRCSIESGAYVFHYAIEHGVCYLTICDKSYPRKLAFDFLSELAREFYGLYGNEVHASGLRPYAFVKFDTVIQKAKRQFQDTRNADNLQRLNDDLQDVTRIMTKNMEDLLWRGDSLDKMSTMSDQLRDSSRKYRRDAKQLHINAMYRNFYTPPQGMMQPSQMMQHQQQAHQGNMMQQRGQPQTIDWRSAFGTGYMEGDGPLLEELGINFSHIRTKTAAVLNPFKAIDKHIMDDTDLAGPLLFCLLFGISLLLSRKSHFSYIYGVGSLGCLSMYSILNLMSETGIDGYRTASVLGYCLLPMVLLSIANAAVGLGSMIGILSTVSILWCTYAASTMFVTVLSMAQQRVLVAYPVGLLYAIFALMTVF
ncbi:SNAP receptor [Sorochytrium milnesiophthora]